MTSIYRPKRLTDFLSYQTTGGQIQFDPEGSSYLFLAYKQKIDMFFDSKALYPYLSDTIRLLADIQNTIGHKESYAKQFPKRLTGLDSNKMTLKFEYIDQKNVELTDNIFQFFKYVSRNTKESLDIGKKIYDTVEDKISLSLVGFESQYKMEGFLAFQFPLRGSHDIYKYKKNIIQSHDESYISLETDYIGTMDSLATNHRIQTTLRKKFPEFSLPTVFLANYDDLGIDTPPFKETILPITKRLLLKELKSIA